MSGPIVADINMDMYLPLFPLKYLEVQGLGESTLGDDVRAVAGEAGVQIQADKEPEHNRFIRSDQYSFIKKGVPALAFKFGWVTGTPEEKTFKAWYAERYHAPSDDLSQPVDLAAAAQFNAILEKLALRVADADQRPEWKSEASSAGSRSRLATLFEKHSHEGPRNCRSLRSAPRFPVELGGVAKLCAPCSTESRMRGSRECCEVGNLGTLRSDDIGKGSGSIKSGCGDRGVFFITLGEPTAIQRRTSATAVRSSLLRWLARMQKIVDARPGMITEVIGLAQHRVADFRSRISVGVFEQPLDALRPKFGGSPAALGDSLGNQEQLVLRFERQDRRFIGDVREKSQGNSAALENTRAPGIAKHGENAARVAIGQNAEGRVETT